MTQVSDELIELRGLRFAYRDWPSKTPGAPALVLLHGYTGHARSWDAFAEAMTDRYRVIALDQRGHGASGWAGPGAYAVAEMVADLEAFVKALGLEGFTLLGLSMGGMVTIGYAGKRPKALAAAVIVDIGPELIRSGSQRIQEGQKAKDVFDSKDEAFAAARAVNPVPPEAHHRHRSDYSLMRTEDGRWTYRFDRVLRSPGELKIPTPEESWAYCAQIAVPTLVIRGAQSDILSPEVAQKMVETIPAASFALVADSGHSVPLDAPEGFLAACRAWLKG